MTSDLQNKKIYVAGHTGMVGSAIVRALRGHGCNNIIGKTIEEFDLMRQSDVEQYFTAEKPNIVIIAAAKVGGILANNTYRAQFLYENLMIQSNLIHAAHLTKAEKLIFLGSSCIYPKLAPQPLKEESLLTDALEETNEPYAIAKIAGIKMCENYYRQYGSNFYSLMPTNLYGPFDNFHPQNAHVLPALIRKFHEAKTTSSPSVSIWGTGAPFREFMYVDDLAAAVLHFLVNIDAKDIYSLGISQINIGTGVDLPISELALIIKEVVGFTGNLVYDPSKPDGTPKKLLDVSRAQAMGWKARTGLNEGIRKAYEWYLANIAAKGI